MIYGILDTANNLVKSIKTDKLYVVESNLLEGYSYIELPNDFNIAEQTLVNGNITTKQKLTIPQEDDVKVVKVRKVKDIKVTTTTGKVFDGDEKSQERMLRAIQVAGITGITTTNWKLADNSIVEVTLEELKEALSLAAQEQSRIWLEQ